jgi:hypothetical protein
MEVINEKDIEKVYLNILKKDYEKYLKNYGHIDNVLNDNDRKIFIYEIIKSKNWIERKIIDIKLSEQLSILENNKKGVIIKRSSLILSYFLNFTLSLLALFLPIQFDWNIILKVISISFSFFWFLASLKSLKRIIFFNGSLNKFILNSKHENITPYEKWKNSIKYDENGKVENPFGKK